MSSAVCRLCSGIRLRLRQGFVHHAVQSVQQLGVRLLEETGGKLVQQAPNVFGGVDKQLGHLGWRHDAFALVQATAPMACSSARAIPDSGWNPTVAELPASEWASDSACSGTGSWCSSAHSPSSVHRRRDHSSASLRYTL